MTETILITGSNRGIGLELVQQYAAQGWRVLACCRRPDPATDLQDRPIDILFNNAGG